MIDLTILRDNREQKGWEFEEFPATMVDATITTGDYTLAELCNHDIEMDTYHPSYAIERKGGNDLISSISSDRERFKAEIKRAADWDCPLHVVIEEPKTTFKRNRGFMQYRDVTWSQVSGTIEKWERYYNVEFHFAGSRAKAMQKTYDLLSGELRSHLLTDA